MAVAISAASKMLSFSLKTSRPVLSEYGLRLICLLHLLVEEDLRRENGLLVDVHLYVDVDGAAGVPAGIDRLDLNDAVRVRGLVMAEEGPIVGAFPPGGPFEADSNPE